MSTTADTQPVRSVWWTRIPRSLASAGLLLALLLITFLAICGTMPTVVSALEQLLSSSKQLPNYVKITLAVAGLVTFLLPVIFMVVAARRKWVTWRFLAISWAAVTPVLVWLSWDEPAILHPLPVEEFSPVFPGAEESYRVLMEYSKQHPSDEAKAFAKLELKVKYFASSPGKGEQWVEYIRKNREALEADWAALAPQRAWLERLAAFERIGDLTPSDLAADIPTFQIWRSLSQRYCAQATLLALDGRRDEACALLAPMLAAGRKLQPSARTLIRAMIGSVVERQCVETALFIFGQGEVSPAARAKLAAALGEVNAPAMARRLVLIEYAVFAPTISRMRLGDLLSANQLKPVAPLVRGPLNFLSALLINPNATVNLHGRYIYALADCAERREIGRFRALREAHVGAFGRELGMKNLGGRLSVWIGTPAYDKIVENYWKLADLRETLGQRLN